VRCGHKSRPHDVERSIEDSEVAFMLYGTVVRYFPKKGFGFIQADYGPDVFFHATALGACIANPDIKPGQAVKYELVPGTEPKRGRPMPPRDRRDASGSEPTGPQAQLVELIDRIPGGSLDEMEQSQQPDTRHPRARRRKPTWRR
jgi:cold shock CspA family protein